jgi:hypothetical protein
MRALKYFVVIYIFVIGLFCINRTYSLSNPESVIQNFVSYIKNGDIESAINLSPFCDDSLVNKINPKEQLLFMDSMLPQDRLIFPFGSIRKYELLSMQAFRIKYFIYSILLPEEFSSLTNINPVLINGDKNVIDRFLSALNVQNLKSLELVRFDLFNPGIQFGERAKRFTDIYKRIYGFDEKLEYTVLYRHNRKYYAGAMTLVRYENSWYILELFSVLANTSSTGNIELVPRVIDYLIEFGINE